MSDTVKVNRNEVELSEELLTLFAKLLVPEIRKFYQSEDGVAGVGSRGGHFGIL